MKSPEFTTPQHRTSRISRLLVYLPQVSPSPLKNTSRTAGIRTWAIRYTVNCANQCTRRTPATQSKSAGSVNASLNGINIILCHYKSHTAELCKVRRRTTIVKRLERLKLRGMMSPAAWQHKRDAVDNNSAITPSIKLTNVTINNSSATITASARHLLQNFLVMMVRQGTCAVMSQRESFSSWWLE